MRGFHTLAMRSRRILRTAFCFAAGFFAIVSAHAQTPEAKDERFSKAGVYVVAHDVEKTSKFYESIFARAPTLKTPQFVGFDIAGGLFAVVSRQAFAPNSVRGDNAIPYIRAKDVVAEYERIKKIAPEALLGRELVHDGPLILFKMADPDGNVVEFYSFAPPKPQ